VLAPDELANLATGLDHGWIRACDVWSRRPASHVVHVREFIL
jgi:hypothetical protein